MAVPTCSPNHAAPVPMEFHCEGVGCTWWTCPSCGAVYDVDRGYRITRAGTVESAAD